MMEAVRVRLIGAAVAESTAGKVVGDGASNGDAMVVL